MEMPNERTREIPKTKELEMTGAEIVLECLKHEGVEVIFGYPGGSVLPLYDALYDSDLRHILVRHEQGAVHAADGYARSTGRPGVCIATSGPGATNLVTGIANAYMDSVPIVAFTGQVGLGLIGKDSFQEADITGITIPITKYNYLVRDVNKLAQTIHEAFYLATTGRPGPVIIDLPKDITTKTAAFSYPPQRELPGYKVIRRGNHEKIRQAVLAIENAKRPVIIAGGGVISSGAHKELAQLVEKTGIPVITTLMGKGAFPEDHELTLGMLGMHGTAYANYAVCEADLVLSAGMRFDDRVTGDVNTFAPKAKIIHIDIDPAEIGKNVRVDIPIVGNCRDVFREILKRIKKISFPEWLERVSGWRRDYPLKYSGGEKLKPQFIVEEISRLTNGEAYITTEVGQNQMWAANYYTCKYPRRFISSGGLGTMGFGLPAAIGVQVAHPEAIVFDIAGDGSVQMTSQELATAVTYRLPINIAILNNNYLGMVRRWQELFFNGRYSETKLSSSPDFVKLAEAYGARGIRVTSPEEVRPALQEAIHAPEPVIIDFIIDPKENVYPMVPAGGSLNKMLGR